MAAAGVGSIVIVGEDGAPAGIVTDRDLRSKVVAEGRDPAATAAADVMSTPLVTVGPGTYGFEALLEMTRRGIHHLVVVEAGRLVGVVSSHDFLRLQATHPVAVSREIGLAASVDDLARLGARVTALVRRLVEEGGTPYDVGRIVAELNDQIRPASARAGRRAGARRLGPPPVPFCWLAFGSEARREQTLRTDQDNGLAYADPPPRDAAAVQAYFARLAAEVNGALVRIGFPECPGRIMASNPEWCQPVSVWTSRFRHWMQESGPQEVLQACIFFDLRPVGGDRGLGSSLQRGDPDRGAGRAAAPRPPRPRRRGPAGRPHRLRQPPRGAERAAPGHRRPQGRRRDAAGRRRPGPRARARARGDEHGRPVPGGGGREVYGEAEGREITDAHQLLQRLRLVHQLECLERGEPADNRINPKRLSHADAVLLRDALHTVARVQAGLRERYATDLLQ